MRRQYHASHPHPRNWDMGEKEKKRFLEGGRDGWMEGVRGGRGHSLSACRTKL